MTNEQALTRSIDGNLLRLTHLDRESDEARELRQKTAGLIITRSNATIGELQAEYHG